MRITQRLLINSAIYHLQENQQAVDKARVQIATGRRVVTPDDDPQSAQQALNARSHLESVQSSLRNLEFSKDWMGATELAQDQLVKVLSSARVLGLQGANDSNSASERQVMASQVREQFKQVVDLANTDYRGQYVFGGFRIDQQPFTITDGTAMTVDYNGDDGSIVHEIEPGSQMTVNVPGSDAAFGNAFQALATLAHAMENNDTAGIRNAINDIDNASERMTQLEATMGSRASTVDAAKSRLQQFQTNLESLVSQSQNVDMAEAALNESSYEIGYQATLTVMSKSMPRSLFDYIA
jgi:flagellar hook-associated protein 3 FlgL